LLTVLTTCRVVVRGIFNYGVYCRDAHMIASHNSACVVLGSGTDGENTQNAKVLEFTEKPNE
jgi:hypothetical protein